MSIQESAFKLWWEQHGSKGFLERMEPTGEQLAQFAFEAGYLTGRLDPGQLATDLLIMKYEQLPKG